MRYFTGKKKQPQAVYLTQPVQGAEVIDYTWAQVADQARRMAAYLQSLGLPPQSNVAIYGKNSAHWVVADLAIWMAGHVSVPLYPTLNAETAAYVLQHSDAKALFIGKLDGKADSWRQVKEIIPQDLPCICLPLAPTYAAPQWQQIIADTAPLQQINLPQVDDMATIMYTSGSTGLPKGVMHSFRSMLHVARLAEREFKLSEQDRFLSYLPMAHAAERALIETVSLFCGAHIFFAHDLTSFQADLQRARPTFFFSVPRLWTKFYQGINQKISPAAQKVIFRLPVIKTLIRKRILKELGLNHVRIAITGSAPLPASIIEWYRDLGLELLEGYAMTENFAYSHLNRAGDNRIGYVGYAQLDVECRLTSEGEIEVKSPGTMLGYYKDPAKTAEDITADGFLRTGDLGEMDSAGCLKITGRIKDIFKTAKGKYIAPVPIEQKLGECPLIESACVGGGVLPQPACVLMLSEQVRLDLQSHPALRTEIQAELTAVLKAVNQNLQPHEKLAFLAVAKEPWTIDNGLLTPTLKIRRQAVEKHYANQFEPWQAQEQSIVWE